MTKAMTFFQAAGRFLVPGTRKVATAKIEKIVARDHADAVASVAAHLAEVHGVAVSEQFVRMNLRVSARPAPVTEADRKARDRAACEAWDAHVKAGTLPDGASSLEDFGYVGPG